MNTHELNARQMRQLKERYLDILVDEGTFAEVLDVDYDEPTDEDLANIDELVPDCVIHHQWDGEDFTEEDFY